MPALMVLINLCFEDSRALERNPTVKVDETWETRNFIRVVGTSEVPIPHTHLSILRDPGVTVALQCDLPPTAQTQRGRPTYLSSTDFTQGPEKVYFGVFGGPNRCLHQGILLQDSQMAVLTVCLSQAPCSLVGSVSPRSPKRSDQKNEASDFVTNQLCIHSTEQILSVSHFSQATSDRTAWQKSTGQQNILQWSCVVFWYSAQVWPLLTVCWQHSYFPSFSFYKNSRWGHPTHVRVFI